MKKSIKKGVLAAMLTCSMFSVFTACKMANDDSTSSDMQSSTHNPESSFGISSDDGSDSGLTSMSILDFDSVSVAVLRQGASGNEVKEVQRRLKLWGYYKGSVDGKFGAGTKAAVVAFQKKNGLTADGVVGKSTYKALGMTGSYNILAEQSNKNQQSGQTGAVNGFSSSDVYLLARTIYAEGRGEPYVGQVAIGAVILNRIRSSEFPNTIAGVVYQKHAFTAVSDGQINLTPNDTAMKAARDAINGWDPTGGAIYYYNPAVATSSWIFDRQTVTVIGKHVFAI